MRNSWPVATARWALPLLFTLVAARAEPPKEVLQVVTDATDALANNDAKRFLDLIDSRTPGYESLYAEVHYMVAAEDEIDSSVEIISDKGAGTVYELELDWVLQFGMDPPRRAIVKCRIERQGRAWKITSLAPLEFFKV
jgi:hypothetical protein